MHVQPLEARAFASFAKPSIWEKNEVVMIYVKGEVAQWWSDNQNA